MWNAKAPLLEIVYAVINVSIETVNHLVKAYPELRWIADEDRDRDFELFFTVAVIGSIIRLLTIGDTDDGFTRDLKHVANGVATWINKQVEAANSPSVVRRKSWHV